MPGKSKALKPFSGSKWIIRDAAHTLERKNKERDKASYYFAALALISFFTADARPKMSTCQQLVLQEHNQIPFRIRSRAIVAFSL